MSSPREYLTSQISECNYDDYYTAINRTPSISSDGRKIVFAGRDDPSRPLYLVWLYNADARSPLTPGPHTLSVSRPEGGEERSLVSDHPRISGDGDKIIFDSPGDYIGDGETGTYIYDISSYDIRRVLTDLIPRWDTGAARNGEPGMTKRVSGIPSINTDGSMISYINTFSGYSGSTGDH
jgi:Tol biopolymer transport system component